MAYALVIYAVIAIVAAFSAATLLAPKPPSTKGKARNVYDLSASNEVPKVGAPKPLLAGRPPQIYPYELAGYQEYIDNRQVTYKLLSPGYGPMSLRELRCGDTPATAFAGLEIQEALPGETPSLFNPNVWTNKEASGIELLGGALLAEEYDVNATFTVIDGSTGRIKINAVLAVPAGSPPGTDIGDIVPLDDATVGQRLTWTGTASNNIEFRITAIIAVDEVEVSPAPTAEADVDCTLLQYAVQVGGNAVYVTDGVPDDDEDATEVAITFDTASKTIMAPLPESWVDLQIGDLIETDKSSLNDGVQFEIMAFSGRYAIVDPPPTNEVTTCSIVLVRRLFGPFPACLAGQTVSQIGFHIFALGGIHSTNKEGKLRTQTVHYEPQYQLIDDYGNTLGPIQSWGRQLIGGRTRTPIRKTQWFDVPPGRYQVYIARTHPETDDTGKIDGLTLGGVLGRIVEGAVNSLYSATDTRLLVKLTANAPLANNADARINGVWQALHPLYEDGDWTEPKATNDIAPFWAAQLLMRGETVNIAEYQAAHAWWQSKGWEYHYHHRDEQTLQQGVEQVLAAGDARNWYDWRTNENTMWRDRERTDAVLVIDDHTASIDGSGGDIPLGMASDDTPKGIIGTYTDPVTGEERTIVAGEEQGATKMDCAGVQSRQQCWELINLELNRGRLRRVPFSAHLQWLQVVLDIGSPVIVQHFRRGWGQFAFAAGLSGLALRVDRELEWPEAGGAYVILHNRAAPGARIDVTRGATDRDLVLASAPDVAVSLGEDGGLPTHVVFGYPGREPLAALVTGVGEGSDELEADVELVLAAPEIFADPGPAPADEYPIAGEAVDLTIDDVVVTVDGRDLAATWTMPADTVAAQLEWRGVGATSWTVERPVALGAAMWSVTDSGDYQVRVRALGRAGKIGAPSDPVTATVSALPLSVTSSLPYGDDVISSIGSMTSRTITHTVIGGVGAITVLWEHVSGDTVSVGAAASAASSFSTFIGTVWDVKAGVYRLRAEDSLGTVAYGPDHPLSFTRVSSGGSGTIP